MMAKYEDKRRASVPATVCRYDPVEYGGARHDRRFKTALSLEAAAREWASARNIEFAVRNFGHHWTFALTDEWAKSFFAQWWPRSAKLVFWNQWAAGIHVHDVPQLIAELERVLADPACPEQLARRAAAQRASKRARRKRHRLRQRQARKAAD